MTKIALIAKQGKGLSFDFNTGLNCSSKWAISDEAAANLTEIYLFNRHKDLSYFGGEVAYTEKVGDRYKIYFRRTQTEIDGSTLAWGQEKAYF